MLSAHMSIDMIWSIVWTNELGFRTIDALNTVRCAQDEDEGDGGEVPIGSDPLLTVTVVFAHPRFKRSKVNPVARGRQQRGSERSRIGELRIRGCGGSSGLMASDA